MSFEQVECAVFCGCVKSAKILDILQQFIDEIDNEDDV